MQNPTVLVIGSNDKTAVASAKRVKLLSCTLPNVIYNIDATNNQLYVGGGFGESTQTIPPGSYDTTTLPTAITTAMTTAGLTGVTVTYSATTYMMTLSASSTFTVLIPSGTTYPN